MALEHGFRRIVVIENDEENGVTAEELRETALEKGLIKEGDIVVTPGDESYEELSNLPSVNGVTVKGEMKSEDLGLQAAMTELSTTEILDIWNKIMNE